MLSIDIEGMDADQIKRFALFLYEENQNKRVQLDEMIARLDEIGKDLKESNKKIDTLTNALLKANSKVEKIVLEYKLRDKEYKTFEKKYHALVARLSLMNTQTYASSRYLLLEDTEDKDGNQKHGGGCRNVLSDFIGEAKLKSLQSDGYNVYTYLDDELVDIDHLCCMAHARAKFKYVLNYLHTFWAQILAYRNDGEYSIDNMAAERAIRPITVQRKNSMFFGRVKGVKNSAVFNYRDL